VNDEIVYEFPLNERIRVFIRLEQLFLQLDHFLAGPTIWDKRSAVNTLLTLLNIFSRNDVKTEVLKELDRQTSKFRQIAKTGAVDNNTIEQLLEDLNEMSTQLYKANGKIGVATMKCNLFQEISQRSTIPGGTCSFDLPGFHYWLEQSDRIQYKNLDIWTRPFIYIRQAIVLILNFIRTSNDAEQLQADTGFYQSSLNSSMPFQLLRVGIQRDLPCFAEISGGKHRYTIRFMEPSEDNNNRPKQSTETIPFSLTCCLL
jgi:cell division protein ZapD